MVLAIVETQNEPFVDFLMLYKRYVQLLYCIGIGTQNRQTSFNFQ